MLGLFRALTLDVRIFSIFRQRKVEVEPPAARATRSTEHRAHHHGRRQDTQAGTVGCCRVAQIVAV